MESAVLEYLKSASESPAFGSMVVLVGLLVWLSFKSGIVVPGQVAKMSIRIAELETAKEYDQKEIALVKASDEACKARCLDLERRLAALEG